MPLFRLICNSCRSKVARIKDKLSDAMATNCPQCGANSLVPDGTGPSSQVMERLDNGLMPRAVERLADAPRLYKERHDKADPLAGTTRVNYEE